MPEKVGLEVGGEPTKGSSCSLTLVYTINIPTHRRLCTYSVLSIYLLRISFIIEYFLLISYYSEKTPTKVVGN